MWLKIKKNYNHEPTIEPNWKIYQNKRKRWHTKHQKKKKQPKITKKKL